MQPLKTYLTKDGWKKDLDETIKDAHKVDNFVLGIETFLEDVNNNSLERLYDTFTLTSEGRKGKQRAKIIEKITRHVGTPQGILHRMDKLVDYCYRNATSLPVFYEVNNNGFQAVCDIIETGKIQPSNLVDDGDCLITVKLGKGVHHLCYDKKGNYQGSTIDFMVKSEGPLFM